MALEISFYIYVAGRSMATIQLLILEKPVAAAPLGLCHPENPVKGGGEIALVQITPA
jgi:hypothetical protein